MNEIEFEKTAKNILLKYVAAGAVTGGVPVPGASLAITVENAAMVMQIASAAGCNFSWESVADSFGTLATVNYIGRQLFVEGARLLSWGAGFTGAPILVSLLGAATAGLQTYVVGLIAIAIAKNGGNPIPPAAAAAIMRSGKKSYPAFLKLAKAL